MVKLNIDQFRGGMYAIVHFKIINSPHLSTPKYYNFCNCIFGCSYMGVKLVRSLKAKSRLRVRINGFVDFIRRP
jgi:hypothetical protein